MNKFVAVTIILYDFCLCIIPNTYSHIQVQRMRDPDKTKRKKWNPIVLRFMLELWEKMGEKNFRTLGEQKILILPSKRQLVRQRAKTPCKSGCDPEAYKLLKKLMDQKQAQLGRLNKDDRDVLLVWDAMGYNAGISYDKNTHQLTGDTHHDSC